MSKKRLEDNLSFTPIGEGGYNDRKVYAPTATKCSQRIIPEGETLNPRTNITIRCSFSRDGFEIYNKEDKQKKGGLSAMQFERTIINKPWKEAISEFASLILDKQKTFCHLFTDKNEDVFMISAKRSKNFRCADVMLLDFDDVGAIGIDDFVDNIKSTGNVPFLVHESLSSSENRRKYHCYFLLTDSIKDEFVYMSTAKRLASFIKAMCNMQADRRVLNASQCAFPGRVGGEFRIIEEGAIIRVKPATQGQITTQNVHLMDEGKKRKGQIVFTTATLAGQAYDAKGDMPQWALGRMRQMDMPELVLKGFRKEDNDPNVKEEDKVVSIYDAHRIGEIWSEQLCTLAMMAIFKDRITHNVTEDFCLMITGQAEKDFIFNLDRANRLGEEVEYQRLSGHEPRHYHLAKYIWNDGFVEGSQTAYTRSDGKRMVPLHTDSQLEILRRAALASYQSRNEDTLNKERVKAKLNLYKEQEGFGDSKEAEARIDLAMKIYESLRNIYTINSLSDIVGVDKRFIFTKDSGWMGLTIPMKYDASIGSVVGPKRRDGQGRRRWLIKRLIERRIIAQQLDAFITDFSHYIPEDVYFRGIVNDLNYIDTDFDGEDLIEIVMNVLMMGMNADITKEVFDNFKKENTAFWYKNADYVINNNFVKYYGAVESKNVLIKGAKYIYTTAVEVPNNYERFSSLLEMKTFGVVERLIKKSEMLVFRKEHLERLKEKSEVLGIDYEKAFTITDDVHSEDFVHIAINYDSNDTSMAGLKQTLSRIIVFGLAMRMYIEPDSSIYISTTGIGMDEIGKKNKFLMNLLRRVSDEDRSRSKEYNLPRMKAEEMADIALTIITEEGDTITRLYDRVFELNGIPKQEEVALYPEMVDVLTEQMAQLDYLRAAYCYESLSQIVNEYLEWVKSDEKRGGLSFSYVTKSGARGYSKLTDQHYGKIYSNSLKTSGVIKHDDKHIIGIDTYTDFITMRIASSLESKKGYGLWQNIRDNVARYGKMKEYAPYTEMELAKYVAENFAPSSRAYLKSVVPGYNEQTYMNQIIKKVMAGLWYAFLLNRDNDPTRKDYDFVTFYTELWHLLSVDPAGEHLAEEIGKVKRYWKEIPMENLLDHTLSPSVASKIVLANGVLSVSELKKLTMSKVIEALTIISRCMLQQGGYERSLHDDDEVRKMIENKILRAPKEIMDVIAQEQIMLDNIPSAIKEKVERSAHPMMLLMDGIKEQEEQVMKEVSCFFDETGIKVVKKNKVSPYKLSESEREAKKREVFRGMTEGELDEFLDELPNSLGYAYGTLTDVLERVRKGRAEYNRHEYEDLNNALSSVGLYALDKFNKQVRPAVNEVTKALRSALREGLFTGRVDWKDYSWAENPRCSVPLLSADIRQMNYKDETYDVMDMFTLGRPSFAAPMLSLYNEHAGRALEDVTINHVSPILETIIKSHMDDPYMYDVIDDVEISKIVKSVIASGANAISSSMAMKFGYFLADRTLNRDIFNVDSLNEEILRARNTPHIFFGDVIFRAVTDIFAMARVGGAKMRSVVQKSVELWVAKTSPADIDVDVVAHGVVNVLSEIFSKYFLQEDYRSDVEEIKEVVLLNPQEDDTMSLCDVAKSCFLILYRDYCDMERAKKSLRSAVRDIIFRDGHVAKKVYHTLKHVSGRVFKIVSQFNIALATIACARNGHGNIRTYIKADTSIGFLSDIELTAFDKIPMLSPDINDEDVLLGVGARGLDGVYADYFRPRSVIPNYEVFASFITSSAMMDEVVTRLSVLDEADEKRHAEFRSNVGVHIAISETMSVFGCGQKDIADNLIRVANNITFFTNKFDRTEEALSGEPYKLVGNPRLASMILQRAMLYSDKMKQSKLSFDVDNHEAFNRENGNS